MIRNDLYTSWDTYELDDKVFDDDLHCKSNDGLSIMFENDLHKSINLEE